MKVSKFIIAMLFVAVAFFNTGCMERIDAGNVGIKVNLYGSEKGVDNVTEVTGRVFYNPWTTEIIEWPTFVQNAVWTRDDQEGSENNEEITFQTNEGLEITADVGMAYAYDSEKVPAMFVKFRKEPAQIQDTYLRTQIRNMFVEAASDYSIEQFIQEKDQFLKQVEKAAKDRLGSEGFIIDTLTFIGSPRYPDSVVKSIQNKINATQIAQQKQRELEQAQAEAAKAVATAKGEADSKIEAARGDAQSTLLRADAEAQAIAKVRAQLTNSYIEYVRANRWDGKYPGVVAGDKASLLLDAR